jgi:hypothetical protein
MSEFSELTEYTNHLTGLYAARNNLFNQMEYMYLLIDAELEKAKKQMPNLKFTLSPDARNQIVGANRLLSYNQVDFSVPHEENTDIDDAVAGKLERFASGVWRAASRVYNNPLESEVALSTLLFAETHIGITKTSDMVARAKGAPPAAIAQLEAIADATPFVFDIWDPRTGYPDEGPYGVRALYREVATTIGAVIDDFGDEARKQFIGEKLNRFSTATLCHLYEFNRRRIWIKGKQDYLYDSSDTLPFLPVVVQLGEGSKLFSKPEHRRQPFLYTLYKSELWSRQNLMLTVMYTAAAAIGANMQNILKTDDPENRQLEIDYSVMGGLIKIGTNEDLGPMPKQVIDPSLPDLQALAERKGEESTIFGQTLGEPLGGNAPYSMVALLHQAGRLPLAMPQLKSSWAIADAMKKCLLWLKHDKEKGKVRLQGKTWELDHAKIPDYFELEAKLDVALPQDKLQMANIIKQLRGFVSDRWLMENVLNIGQPDAEMKEAWSEQAANMWFTNFMHEQMQSSSQVPPQDVPPGTPPPPGGQEGMTPEMMGSGRPLEPMPGEPPADGKMVPEMGGMMG